MIFGLKWIEIESFSSNCHQFIFVLLKQHSANYKYPTTPPRHYIHLSSNTKGIHVHGNWASKPYILNGLEPRYMQCSQIVSTTPHWDTNTLTIHTWARLLTTWTRVYSSSVTIWTCICIVTGSTTTVWTSANTESFFFWRMPSISSS